MNGTVYLAGPYTDPSGTSYPFSLSIVVPVAAGPYNLGTQVVQAGIAVDPTDAHLTTVATLPTTQTFPVGSGTEGLLLRIQSVNLTLDRPGFIKNGTNCSPLTYSSTLGGVDPIAALMSSVTGSGSISFSNCGALAFSPTLTMTAPAASAATSSTNGAGLDVKLTQPPGQSNIKSVVIDFPSAFSARLSTINGACPVATYTASASRCPATSLVGTVTATTPLLPGSLTGPAYLVSYGATGLPSIDVALQDDGVTFNLSVAISFSSTESLISSPTAPDVPISSFELNLPEGPHSALAASANLCLSALTAPTTLNGQSGAQVKENIAMQVTGCPKVATVSTVHVGVLKHTYKNGKLTLTVKSPVAGRLSLAAPAAFVGLPAPRQGGHHDAGGTLVIRRA